MMVSSYLMMVNDGEWWCSGWWVSVNHVSLMVVVIVFSDTPQSAGFDTASNHHHLLSGNTECFLFLGAWLANIGAPVITWQPDSGLYPSCYQQAVMVYYSKLVNGWVVNDSSGLMLCNVTLRKLLMLKVRMMAFRMTVGLMTVSIWWVEIRQWLQNDGR